MLREQEAGARTEEVCRRHGIRAQPFTSGIQVRWPEISDAKRLKALEDENRRLKRLLADSLLDNAALKDLLGKTSEACGAARSGDEGDGASRAESATCVRAGRVGSFDPAISVQTTGRLGNQATIEGAAAERRRFGYRRLGWMLEREGTR